MENALKMVVHKKLLFGFLCIFLISLFIFMPFINSLNENKFSKVEKRVLQDLAVHKNIKVIVKFSNNESFYKNLLSLEKTIGKKNLRVFSSANAFSAELTMLEIEKLNQEVFIEYISPNRNFKAALQNSVEIINATSSWNLQSNNLNLTGVGETICIIDTGVNYTHSDLGGCYGNNNASSNCKVIGGYDFVNDDSNPLDDNGHGTHVAGIAAANGSIMGVAPNAKIVALKVLGSTGSGNDEDILNAIDWCVNNASLFNISVISMSLGIDCDTYPEYCYSNYCDNQVVESSYRDAINSAFAKNISVVASTGNNGITTGFGSPACIKNATRVASANKLDVFSSFSNRGSNFQILVAPGEDINSTMITNPLGTVLTSCGAGKSYCLLDGTSMAAPHVSGAIAILRQYLNSVGIRRTPFQVENTLNNTGKLIWDSSSGKNYSRIDVYSALMNISDLIFPNFTSNTTTGTYLRYSLFTVNITIRDNLGLSRVWFESNHTGDLSNYTYIINGTESNRSLSFNITTTKLSFSYRWGFNDSFGNTNYTTWQTRVLVNSAPVNLTIPIQNWVMNSNLTFNLSQYFFDADADELNYTNTSIEGGNISIILNQTNKFVTLIPDTGFNGTRYMRFFANDSINATYTNNITLIVFKPAINFTYVKFNSSTTNFSNLTDYVNVPVIISATDYGQINFSALNLTNQTIDINSYVNISQNRIEINTSALPSFNISATLSLYNVSLTYPAIYKDGLICPTSSGCIQINYTNTTFIFNVSGFSVYDLREASCSDSVQNGAETGVDCGGSCSACPTGGSPGGGGGGGSSITVVNITNTTSKIETNKVINVSKNIPNQSINKTEEKPEIVESNPLLKKVIISILGFVGFIALFFIIKYLMQKDKNPISVKKKR